MHYDIIGDIHGQADKLEALLRQLGYREAQRTWRPPVGRHALFVGDLIDRGPQQLKAVDLVRRMVDAGLATCLLGNHEFNAVAFATSDPRVPGQHLRRRNAKNVHQHSAFLREVLPDSAAHRDIIDWFRTLPVFVELGHFRAVHAWWNEEYVQLLRARLRGGPLEDEFMQAATTEGSAEFAAMEGLTKGLEIALPPGFLYADPDGMQRDRARVRWWLTDSPTYGEYLFLPPAQRAQLPVEPVPASLLAPRVQGSPVFVGHYWMTGAPRLQTSRLACVDYSAAKNGPLVAYRWQGELDLDEENFVCTADGK